MQEENKKFLQDLKKYHDVMVYASHTGMCLKTTKKEARKEAERTRIKYRITNDVFKNRRDVILIY